MSEQPTPYSNSKRSTSTDVRTTRGCAARLILYCTHTMALAVVVGASASQIQHSAPDMELVMQGLALKAILRYNNHRIRFLMVKNLVNVRIFFTRMFDCVHFELCPSSAFTNSLRPEILFKGNKRFDAISKNP